MAGSRSGAILPRSDSVSDGIRCPVQGIAQKQGKIGTYRVANLLGFVIISGHNTKARTKHASAPILHPAKIRSRSHLLTVKDAGQPLGLLHSITNKIQQPLLHVDAAHMVREIWLTQGQWNIERRQ